MSAHKDLYPNSNPANEGGTQWDNSPLEVNGHIHTPYSFSAFSDLEQAFAMAQENDVKILGINDFNTFDGYQEFCEMGVKHRVFPLFNIEFMGLLEDEQRQGVRINDPANPGRIYFSGKGLDFPPRLSGTCLKQLESVRAESLSQTRSMVEKASTYLQSIDPNLALDYNEILRSYTRGMLRERHIAKAVRVKVFERHTDEKGRRELLSSVLGGKAIEYPLDNVVRIENDIRGYLLKSGGPAFVKEEPKAFLPLQSIIQIIHSGGGIPCYPVLLDDSKGNYTEYEANMEKLSSNLKSIGVQSVELIPGRNDIMRLTEFVRFFYDKGFIVTLGTEHNTPELAPLLVTARGNTPLNDFLRMVNYEGACIIAAHQYLRAQGEVALASATVELTFQLREQYSNMGNSIIKRFVNLA